MVKNLDFPKNNKDKKFVVSIPYENISLKCTLRIPHNAKGVIIILNRNPDSERDKENTFIAGILRKSRASTLTCNLLTEEENVKFLDSNIQQLLESRLIYITEWILKNYFQENVGYFSTDYNADFVFASAIKLGNVIKAIVLKRSIINLDNSDLAKIKPATLIITGEKDINLIRNNQKLYKSLITTKRLEVIPDLNHIYEDTVILEDEANIALDWFKKYLNRNFMESFY